MKIRLNKALRELNIGFQTAIDFLGTKKELGDVNLELSSKINDAQYNALVHEFKKDAEVKEQAEKIFPKKQKERPRKKEKETEPAADGNSPRGEDLLKSTKDQKYKVLGKIDLGEFDKKLAPKKETAPEDAATPAQESEKQEEPVPGKAPETVKEPVKEAEEEVAEETIKEEPKAENKEVAQEKPEVEDKEETPQSSTSAPLTEKDSQEEKQPAGEPKKQTPEEKEKESQEEDTEIFQLNSEKRMLKQTKVNVLGKIDLSAINQSTRPKKKTKEERRKEREEKAQERGRKKRVRINQQRVDISSAASQDNNQIDKKGRKKKKRVRNQKPLEVDGEDVARQVKETLVRLTNKTKRNKRSAKYRREKRDAVQERMNAEAHALQEEKKTLKLTEFVTVSDLANMMNVDVNKVISTLMSIGLMVSINERLDAETINMVAEEFGFDTEFVSADVQEAVAEEEDDENDLVSRPPIVTVMGHVDHGKTSLLDYIRNTNVVAGEAGGITQHIGAYNVTLENGRKITFLDTPGHEAFTAMRARGTQVTDIAIIIVAADDSVMPTTKEAIAHAQAAGVPMIFAINKIDKPGANPEKIRTDLANMNLLVEDWGGKYPCQEISAKKGVGIKELLEKVLLLADMLDLKANPNRRAVGHIVESTLDKGRGYVSTVLVGNGTLKIGDDIVAGSSWGRIKAMYNERNQNIEQALPAEPALILGLNGAPTAGDKFNVLDTEQEVRDIANKRTQLAREQDIRTQKRLTLNDISHRIALGSFKELNIIVKGDTDGSVEALSDSFIKLSTQKIKVNVIFKAVGHITESDIDLADASDALIIGFQVRPSAQARRHADQTGVEINTYSVIYDAINDVRSAMEGMLDTVKKDVTTGEIQVKQIFKISKVGTVAGGIVSEGKVHSNDQARVVRDGIVIHTTKINVLKRYKDDVKEVAAGLECGVSLVNFDDIREGDIIETFTQIEIQQKLE